MAKNPELDSLMDTAFELIEKCQYDQAIEIAKQLKEKRHSSNFEIMALAYQGKGENQKAISVLEDGVKTVPTVWLLWQLLGNIYSDENCHEKSQNCYLSALNCPDADKSSIHLNSSIDYLRDDKPIIALKEIGLVTDELVPSIVGG